MPVNIPPSPHTVEVSIIDSTMRLRSVPTAGFMYPTLKGHETFSVPGYSFHIRNVANGKTRTLVFDLALRKDWHNLSPPLVQYLEFLNWDISVTHNVQDVLAGGGVDLDSIDAVIWSHHHFDHVGDMSIFGPQTSLIVGPGFKSALLPGYPANPESSLLERDFSGREVVELDFSTTELRIGEFDAIDYFGDGSFYLLNAPGHAIGHVCGLARVEGDAFVLMAGDAVHHSGELRPSSLLPLPDEVAPNPLPVPLQRGRCGCALFQPILRDGDRARPFYRPTPSGAEVRSVHHDPEEAERTAVKLQKLDAEDNIFVVFAHDGTLLDVVDFFPAKVTGSLVRQWDAKARWKFLADLAGAVSETA